MKTRYAHDYAWYLRSIVIDDDEMLDDNVDEMLYRLLGFVCDKVCCVVPRDLANVQYHVEPCGFSHGILLSCIV